MAKGIYYYKLVSPYPEDVTKNCKLTINEIDSNFLSLKDEDIKSAELVKDEKMLVLTRNDGEKLIVDLKSVAFDLNVETNFCSENGASITISYDGEEGPKSVTFGNLVTVDYLNSLVDSKILKKVITDGTLRGNGTIDSPLGLARTEKTGVYAPVKTLFDLTKGGKLPQVAKPGTRYLTKEYINDYGYLYNGKALEKIKEKLEKDKRGWRIPTKGDWDALLNSIEPCDNKNHDNSRCHVELGKLAGKLLKSECGWIGQSDCTCTNTKPITSCTKNDLDSEMDEFISGTDKLGHPMEKEVSPIGVDKYGMTILPAGMAHVDAYGKILAEDYKAKAYFWTDTHLGGDADQDRYVKEFSYKNSGVAQEAICPSPYYSVRLVKDYDGKNYFDSEYIDGILYKTILFAESGQIWLATNYASKEELEGDGHHHHFEHHHGHHHNEKIDGVTEVNNGEVPSKRKVFFLNEWNGYYWEKKMLSEGDTVVIEDPCFEKVEPKEIKYCWKTILDDEEVDVDAEGEALPFDDKECETITIERGEQFNLEYRVYTNDGCDQEIANTDDLILERLIEAFIPVIVKEKEDRMQADKELEDKIDDLEEKLDSVTDELEGKIEDLDKKINDEIERATSAETALDTKIDEETERAKEAEAALDTKIDEETERAKGEEERIEKDLYEAIYKESERAQDVEGQLWGGLNGEIERAQTVEKQLWDSLNAEIKNREEVDNQIWEELVNEAKTREEIDNQQWKAINDERDRAIERENEIDGQLVDQSKSPYKLSASVEKGEYNMVLESKDGKDEHSIKIEFDGNFGEF